MKYLLIIIMFFSLTSCFKKEQVENKDNQNIVWVRTSSWEINETKKEEISPVEIIWNDNGIFSVDNIPVEKINNDEIEIRWKVFTQDVEKIQVTFQNRESSFASDEYVLKTYISWSDTFRYVAWSRFRVLDYGMNEYIFKAFLKSGETKEITVKIYLSKNWESEKSTAEVLSLTWEVVISSDISYEKKLFWPEEDKLYMSFPQSTSFWFPNFSQDNEFTYSNIEWFIAKKQDIKDLSCENSDSITEYLVKNYGNVYWNTCRPIVKEKGFSFYVLRLEWENYVYEKHYVDTIHSIYAVYEVEVWEWVTKENLPEKNNELKLKEFLNVKLVDKLMYEIVR